MRTFHLTWMTFFLCFFGWFGIAPLMPVIREELHLSKGQIGNIMIASVAVTIFARLLIGWICDKIGPRITYSILLFFGAFPVMLIGLSNSYESFLLFRLTIGVIGASFVITQYHTSVMFAPNIVGTANATVAGWGNLGGGVTQMVMPLIFAGFVGLGYMETEAWRYSMIVPGLALLLMSPVYYFFTQDLPQGNLSELKKDPTFQEEKKKSSGSFTAVLSDYRVWILFLVYGCCFGIEITIDNIAALYFKDKFNLSLAQAGIIAGLFGCMNLFARALGGIASDRTGKTFGLRGRVIVLASFLFLEGWGIILFSQTTLLAWAVGVMLLFALFVKMSNGATYSVVPFVNQKSLGLVSGIVGAGGNLGALLFAFVFKAESITYDEGFMMIGLGVCVVACLALLIKFPTEKVKSFVEIKSSTEQKTIALQPEKELVME
ncbi:MAG TPA: NarK family nitrate/nitrite MFS transporter [Cytophagaceae bacterium]|nr:NarK family nitrate/nitrite MFS transporter [Cytophagaceae bacterium]